MRSTIPASLLTVCCLALYAVGCGATADRVSLGGGGDGGTAGAGGQGGAGGTAGSGGQACVPATEACDGMDNDCDAEVDEECACVNGETQPCYSGAMATIGVGSCMQGQQTCNLQGAWGTCVGEVVPGTETCNNIDDDCNGTADDMGTTTCGVGACSATVPVCVNGQPGVCTTGNPSPELCDGIDNDCDQLVDETYPGKGQTCDTGNLGACSVGKTDCMMGVPACVQQAMPTMETCNGMDDDCSGTADDNIPGTGIQCGTGLPGVCSAGIYGCKNGTVDCHAIVSPSAEACNGLDDDCDGDIDENNPSGNQVCTTGLSGICGEGITACTGGMVVCNALNTSTNETCNGADDDCDGMVDDGTSNLPCSTGNIGACGAGLTLCTAGALSCVQTYQPSPEVCDGLDNNCTGTIDENNPDGGAVCTTGLNGVCNAGTITCVSGALSCVQNNQPGMYEICGNGLDDNCDGITDPPVQAYLSESFSNAGNNGWTVGTDWAIGSAVSGCSDPASDTTPTSDNRMAGVVLGGCAPTAIHGYYYLTSPVINTAAAPSVYLSFRRWLNSDYTPYMNSVIEVYNGSAWTVVYQNGSSSVYDSSWQNVTYNLSAYKNANMQIRWGFNIGSTGVFSVGQWNIDDVLVSDVLCQ